MNKILVVGCPRSGTTLVQMLLGIRSDVYTCRETHYFQRIRRVGKAKLLDYLYLAPTNVMAAYDYIRAHNELLEQHDPGQARSFPSAVAFFDQLMTREAIARGKTTWVEKTPAHLFYIPWIQRHIPSARFVHVMRDGRDVVASLVDAARQHPHARAWKRYADPETAIAEYNRYLQESLKHWSARGHVFVQYEHILDNATAICHELYAQLGLEQQDLSLDLAEVHSSIVRADEAWKSVTNGAIRDTRLEKFNRIFEEGEKKQITHSVRSPSPRQRAGFI